MNNTVATQVADALAFDLRALAAVCEELLALAKCEHQALSGPGRLQSSGSSEKRKELLPGIESLVKKLREHRTLWQRIPPAQREHFTEQKRLFQNIQGLMMKIMSLDRENQQAMLTRGLVPVQNLPPVAAQKPHFVADLYRKNSVS